MCAMSIALGASYSLPRPCHFTGNAPPFHWPIHSPMSESRESPDLAEEPSVPTAESAPHHDPYSALRIRDFRFYMVGWVASVVGSQMLEAAIAWDLYQRTKNPLSLAWVGLCSAAPIILLALPAGHVADRFDRRRIMILMQILITSCAIALGFLSYFYGPLWAIYSIIFLAAVGKAIGWPARAALIPSLVPAEIFHNAIAWNTTAFESSSMAGSALAGVLIAWKHAAPYCVTAVCGIIFISTILPIKKRPAATKREPMTLESVAAGVRYVLDHQIILAMITLDLFAVLLGGATYILPIFATDILQVGAHGFGILRASFSIGALSCALVLAHLPPMKRAGRALLLAVTAYGIATIIFGLSKNFWLSVSMLFLTGVFDNISVFVRHTLVQILTPDSMRGRVSAVNNIFVGASNELGGFESGLTARFLGAAVSVIGGGIGTVLVVVLTNLKWPAVRRFGSLADARPQDLKPAAVSPAGDT
jgi:MFS family permease